MGEWLRTKDGAFPQTKNIINESQMKLCLIDLFTNGRGVIRNVLHITLGCYDNFSIRLLGIQLIPWIFRTSLPHFKDTALVLHEF